MNFNRCACGYGAVTVVNVNNSAYLIISLEKMQENLMTQAYLKIGPKLVRGIIK